jgi:hypothetical protein
VLLAKASLEPALGTIFLEDVLALPFFHSFGFTGTL